MLYVVAFTARVMGPKLISTHEQIWQKSNTFRAFCTHWRSAIEFMRMLRDSIQVLYKLSWMTQPIRGVCRSCTHVSVELAMQTLTQHIVTVLPSNWRIKRSDHLKAALVVYYWWTTEGKRERERKKEEDKMHIQAFHSTLNFDFGLSRLGSGTFHTCNLEGRLALFFICGYKTLLQSLAVIRCSFKMFWLDV